MAHAATLNKEQKRHLLLTMLESRHGDLREESLNRQGKGHFHVSGRGHEAMAAIGAQLRESDFLVPYYRDRGLCMGRGLTTRHLALEYFAKRDSASRGRMMPSHYCSRELNIVSVPTPTGAQLVPACGIAWGLQLDQKDGIVVTCIGDAATRQGDFYEALSFAVEKKLPVLFLCEDNGFSNVMPRSQHSAHDIQSLAAVLMPTFAADGTDVLSVYEHAGEAVAQLRRGEGPVFLHCATKRWMKHQGHEACDIVDNGIDRERDCPIRKLEAFLLKSRLITPAELAQIEQAVEAEIDAAIQFAESSPFPDPSLLEVS